MISKFLFLLVISLVPVLMWISVYTFLNATSRFDAVKISLYGVMLGILAMLPVLMLQFFWETYPELNVFALLQKSLSSTTLFYGIFFLFVSLLEEGLKAFALIFLVMKFRRSFDQIVDGIVFGAFVALGFAFAENIYYFMHIVETYELSFDFLSIFSLRSFGTMLSHTIFTGTFGIFYAIAYFAHFKNKSPFSIRKVLQLRFIRNFFFPEISKPKNIYRYIVLSEGFLIACLMHWIFNFLVKVSLYGVPAVYFTIPFLLFSSLWLWSNFFDEKCLKVLSTSKRYT